ncbi:Rhodanese-like domain containing protein [Tritrichomonas foetus]|uniref:M-phase inducer phosphatase n=1 Tax=Tritrichomonas foetus TaxID=1144522 RepID=A0A1J4K5L0_9EUKA|nr:Rhodanese-like domain containing protein [Tritrichomonas foetus]|eukprot:OHT05012.1 Rhodanese-like domain containing protein [Tritrichomonas foetus]
MKNFAFQSPIRHQIPVPELDDSPRTTPKKSPPRLGFSPRKSFIPTLPLNGSIPRITGETLASIIMGDYDEFFDYLYIIDCRYDYEYQGGHIMNAMNCNNPEILQSLFFNKPIDNAVIVFHCEFSQNRGPQMAAIFREKDREFNKMEYPNLYYHNVFILDGGYKKFYEMHRDFCEGGYTKMLDDAHKMNGDLMRANTNFKKNVTKIRSALCTIPPNRVTYESLKSPTKFGKTLQSPMSSKMISFFSSPPVPRRSRKESIE